MKDFRLVTHATAVLVLALLSVRLWRNLRFLRRVRQPAALSGYPRVSVLVPARNEARTITACVTSLLRQDYPDFEVIVLDDASTDSTGAQLDALAARFPQLNVRHSMEDVPAGWNGKSYACHRLAQQASGDWLLFTDADTAHTPHSIRRGVEQALHLNAALLSVLPYQQTGSWSERLLVSFIVDFLTLLGLDLEGRGGRVAANGQYLLVRADAYHKAGGHAAIAGELVDDFALAKLMQANVYKTALVDGTDMVRCRMYHSAGEVWNGFSKNLMLALALSSTANQPRGWFLLFGWAYACLFVLPFVFALIGLDRRLALVEIGWLGLLRALVGRQLKRPNAEIFTTPLAAWGVMALGLSAVARRWRARPVMWKGRTYKA